MKLITWVGKVFSERDGTPSSLRIGMFVVILTICGITIHSESTHQDLSANLRDILIWLGGIVFAAKAGSKPFEGGDPPAK